MLRHIELKFCIWLCFTVLQIKFECRQFASSVEGVMHWKYTVFCTFLLHALTYWAEILHMTLFSVLQIKFECHQFALIFVGVMPILELRILEIHSFLHFSLTCFDKHVLSWNFAYDLICITVLQVKFECRQFASIFVGVMPLLELTLLEIHSFPHFSLTCFYILSWNFSYDFV